MLWIVGGGEVIGALSHIAGGGPLQVMARQLQHKAWAGFAFEDLIFPLFVFIVGMSVVLSIGKVQEKHGTSGSIRRILSRGALLYILGLVTYGGISHGWEGVRLLGVLQRIAICYVVTALLFCGLRLRGLVVTCVALLVGYWALMTFVPIRNITVGKDTTAAMFHATTAWVSGTFDPGLNLANHLDFQYLPGRRWDGAYDPEGLLSTLPAIASCLMGVFAGLWLKNPIIPDAKKVKGLAAAGALAVVLGFAWGLQFPVIKKIWTSSYVLVAGGYSCLLVAAFYQVVDVWNHRRWATPFIWVGMNPMAIYLAHALFSIDGLAARLVGGPVKAGLGMYGGLLESMVALGLGLALLRFMYQRRIFLRV